jgi:dipeptidyl aminopeptidase/acylaminoacyl peptidase
VVLAARLSTVWILVLASLALAAPAHATFPGANGKIAFARCYWQANYGYCGRSDVYTMNADGSNPVNLTAAWASSYDPAWSPDGTKIALNDLPAQYQGDEPRRERTDVADE